MPSAAERTRTLVQSTCSAVLLVPGASAAAPDGPEPLSRSVGPDGDLFLEFPSSSPVVRAVTHPRGGEPAGVLEITDVAPVAVPHRVRGRARICGRLTAVPGLAGPGRTVLCLETAEIHVEDLWGAGPVTREELRDASADPLAAHETELLQHLHAAHGDTLGTLCALLGERGTGSGTADGPAVVPLALDRLGLRVRVVAPGGTCFDARFEFPEPVRDAAELSHALHILFQAAAA
ncbi:DUF2470 domain-containing protein [Streptomyces sp. NPDC057682]|uniref:DUF2470 domain-containing protein n=1 Tax=unclassified Streptomyces TaxID=2593676 RepID=UPI00366425FD